MPNLHLRWWMWVLAILLLLVAGVLSIHVAGMARLADTQAELKRLGYATTLEELVAAAPPVDPGRQARFRRLMESRAGWQDGVGKAWPVLNLSTQRPPAKDVAIRDQALIDGEADMRAVATLFDEGPVAVSLYGWCERDPAKLRTIGIDAWATMPVPNFLGVRAFAYWWSDRACLDADPEPHLRRLDHLLTSMDRPGTLIDALIVSACSSIRDRTHLWLATRGRLSHERLLAWMAEPPREQRWCAAGLAGERCAVFEPLSRWHFNAIPPGSNLGSFLLSWISQGFDCANAISTYANTEASLVDAPHPSISKLPFGYMGPVASESFSSATEYAVSAVVDANRHRLQRLAAVIAVHHREHGSLPTLAELPASLLAGHGPDLPPLLYETFPPHRFRIGIDPAGPLPPAIPAERWKDKYYGSEIGQPPSKWPESPAHRWSLELDLDAILVPPPEPKPRPPKPEAR